MIIPPQAQMNQLKEEAERPPLTDNYEKINFKNMNIFSKITDLPNHKNKKTTEKFRKIIRDKVINSIYLNFNSFFT